MEIRLFTERYTTVMEISQIRYTTVELVEIYISKYHVYARVVEIEFIRTVYTAVMFKVLQLAKY